eukprot:gene4259-14370_t
MEFIAQEYGRTSQETPRKVADPEYIILKSVARDQLRILRAAGGVSDYYGCTFGADHFGLVNMSVHSVVQGFTTQEALEVFTTEDMLEEKEGNGGVTVPTNSVTVAAAEERKLPTGSFSRRSLLRLALNIPDSPRESAMGSPSSTGSSGPNRPFADDAPPLDNAHAQKSLSSALASAMINRRASIPDILSATSLDGKATDVQLRTIEHLYISLVHLQRKSLTHLSQFLKGVPKRCYQPQSYEALRLLLLGDAPRATSGQSSDGVPLYPGVDGTSWPEVPEPYVFMARLPAGCSVGVALQLMEAALRRVRQLVWAEWQSCVIFKNFDENPKFIIIVA